MAEEQDVSLSIHLTEDANDTVAVARLDLRGDHFEATGRARRSPDDPVRPVVGEELAIARALQQMQEQLTAGAWEKIERFLEEI